MKDLLVPLILVLMLCIDRHYHVCLRERLERIELALSEVGEDVAKTSVLTAGLRDQVRLELDAISDHIQRKIDEEPVTTVAPKVRLGVLSPEVHWETMDEILDRRAKK